MWIFQNFENTGQQAVPGRIDMGHGTSDENKGRSRIIRDVWSPCEKLASYLRKKKVSTEKNAFPTAWKLKVLMTLNVDSRLPVKKAKVQTVIWDQLRKGIILIADQRFR